MKYQLLFLSITPSIAFIIWLYLKDKYEREPFLALFKFFALGILISFVAITFENLFMNVKNFNVYPYYMSFVVSALTEEGLKAIVLIPCLLNEKNFNERLDAIVYSVFLTLGFATVENIIYIVYGNYNEAINLAITRGIISIPAHIMFAITMGYYIAKYKFSNQKRENLFLAILLPILQHGIFNFILMIKNKFSLWIFIIYTVVLMKLCLDKLDMYVKDSKKKHT